MSLEIANAFQQIIDEEQMGRDVVLPIAAENPRMPSAIAFCMAYHHAFGDLKDRKTGYEDYVTEVATRFGVPEKDIPELLNIYENNLRV